MTLRARVGTLTLNTSTGHQSVTGLGFQPQWVMFLTAGLDALDTFGNNFDICQGWSADAPFGSCINTVWYDGTGGSNQFMSSGDFCISSQTAGAQCHFFSLDADGFTIDVTTAPATGVYVSYLAIGGANEVQGSRQQWLSGAGGGGQTGIFTPPHKGNAWLQVGTFGAAGLDTYQVRGGCVMGFCTGDGGGTPTDGGVAIAVQEAGQQLGDSNLRLGDRAMTDTAYMCTTAYSLGCAMGGPMSTFGDGWTASYSNPGVAACYIEGNYIWTEFSVGGTPFQAHGAGQQPTAPGTQFVSCGFMPKVVFLASVCDTNLDAATNAKGAFSVGFTDGSYQGCIYGGGQDSAKVANRYHTASSALVMADYTDTVRAAANVARVPGGFNINWTAADATARDYIYMAFSDERGDLQGLASQIYRRVA